MRQGDSEPDCISRDDCPWLDWSPPAGDHTQAGHPVAFPYRAGGFMINPPPLNEGCCKGRQVGRDEQDGFD